MRAPAKGEREKGSSRRMNTSFPLKSVIPHYHCLSLDNSLYSASKIAPCSAKPFMDNNGQKEGPACHRILNLSHQLKTDKD